jgi:hypothetical protein
VVRSCAAPEKVKGRETVRAREWGRPSLAQERALVVAARAREMVRA